MKNLSFAIRRRARRDSKGVSARARADGRRTLYASSAVSCFARAAGNVTRISSYLRVARGGRRVRTASGRRAHEARPLGDDRKMSVIRGLLMNASNVARAAKRRKRVVSSDEAGRVADRHAPRGEPVGDGEAQRVVLGAACGRGGGGGDISGVSGGDFGSASRGSGRADASRIEKRV